jgi:hypothetical protein
MNTDKLNQWLMVASNVAVLAGIIFLALEIQQNSDALLAGSQQDLLESDISVLENLMLYPQLYDPAMHDSLEGLEASRLQAYFVMIMRIREFAWNQYNNGVLDQQTLDAYLAPLEFIFDSETGREFLLNQGFRGDLKFVQYVLDYMGLESE